MKKFTEEDIKRTGLPQDVFDLLHDLCYHVNNNLRGTMDEKAIENYVGRAKKILGSSERPNVWVSVKERLPEDCSDVLAAIWWINKDNPSYSHYGIHDCLYQSNAYGRLGIGSLFVDCEGEEFSPEDVQFWIYKKDLAAILPIYK
jgi:hypothetical protein